MILAVIKVIIILQILATIGIVIHAQINWDGELPDDDTDNEDDDPLKYL